MDYKLCLNLGIPVTFVPGPKLRAIQGFSETLGKSERPAPLQAQSSLRYYGINEVLACLCPFRTEGSVVTGNTSLRFHGLRERCSHRSSHHTLLKYYCRKAVKIQKKTHHSCVCFLVI